MTRSEIKINIQDNLADLGNPYTTDDDLNDSIQDAYDDVAALSQCITNSVTLNWITELSYLNFRDDYGINDYLSTVAIFNNRTNRWLRDDLTLRDFDRIRRDWENWIGTPQFWAPSDPLRIAIAPKYPASGTSGAFNPFTFSDAYYIGSSSSASGTFRLVYWAQAPALTSDASSFLIATDAASDLIEFYSTADLLEQCGEITKAQDYWTKYYNTIVSYSDRVKRNNKHDLLLRV